MFNFAKRPSIISRIEWELILTLYFVIYVKEAFIMEFTIHSSRELSENELSKIKGIIEESNCINESLSNTFTEDETTFDKNQRVILFNSDSNYNYTVTVDHVKEDQ